MRLPSRSSALLALHGAVVLFGFAALFGKWLPLSPVLIVLGRTAIAAASLGLVRHRQSIKPPPFELRLIGNGAVLALHWVSFFAAIQTASVAIGLLGYASFPLFTLILERALLKRLWTARELATAGLVVGGLLLVVPAWRIDAQELQGLAWGVLSGLTFALLAVLNRGQVRLRPALDIAFWQNAMAAVCLLPFAWPALAEALAPSVRDVILLLVLGVVCTALAHTLFIASLRVLTAHVASVIAALEPVYGMLLAWVLLGEAPSLRLWAGAALLVGAAILAARRPSVSALLPGQLGAQVSDTPPAGPVP